MSSSEVINVYIKLKLVQFEVTSYECADKLHTTKVKGHDKEILESVCSNWEHATQEMNRQPYNIELESTEDTHKIYYVKSSFTIMAPSFGLTFEVSFFF